MDITLYEKVDMKKLHQVINCINLPIKSKNDKDVQVLYQKLNRYYKKKITKNGIEIKYKQPNKFGRFYAPIGLQNFPKDIRKYIISDYYQDLDFSKAHHRFIKDLFIKYEIRDCEFLNDYLDNPEVFFDKYNTDKSEMIQIINNDIVKNKTFEALHNKIYKHLIPKLKTEYKVVFDRIKKSRIKDKKNYNFDGAFFASFLQNIENECLQVMYNHLNQNGFTVGSLQFDGVLVEKNTELVNHFNIIEDLIKNKIGFSVNIVEKSTYTNWIPVQRDLQIKDSSKDITISNKFSIETFNILSQVKEENEDGIKEINQEKLDEFLKYTNQFLCLFEDPHFYGWRDNTSKHFSIRPNSQIVDRTSNEGLYLWKNSDSKLQYEKIVFLVDENHFELKNNVYNRYIRPSMKESEIDIFTRCPIYFDFLKRVISDNDEQVFHWLLNYISKMVQKGMTKQILILMGSMGTGKGTFSEILQDIIGENYCQTMNDILQMSSQFNSLSQTSILTIVEEVVNDAGDYHKVNSKLKSLVTESKILIQKKGIDQFMDYSNNNIIINSNGSNPIHITDDNRRAMILLVKPIEQNNSLFFNKLRKEVNENLEYIRYYFYKYDFINDLNSIRPTTKAEINILNLNKTPLQLFVNESLVLYGLPTAYNRKSSFVYEKYKEFCKDNSYKIISHKYFRGELERILGTEFYIHKSGNFIQGFYGDENLSEHDEDF